MILNDINHDIDWSQAPVGTTHFIFSDVDSILSGFYTQVGVKMFFMGDDYAFRTDDNYGAMIRYIRAPEPEPKKEEQEMSNIDWSNAPEGATHFHPAMDGKFSERFFMKTEGGWRVWYMGEWQGSIPSASGISIDRFIAKPEAWTGTGLPPVGTVCEYYIDDDKWRQCEIVAHKDGHAVIWITAAHVFSARSSGLLRPIRTPEQIEAEERESKVQAMLEITTALHISNMREAMEELYREGYRKQPKEDA